MTLEEIEKKIINGIIKTNNAWHSDYDIYKLVYGMRPNEEVLTRREREEKWKLVNDTVVGLIKSGVLSHVNSGYNYFYYKLKGL